MNETWLQTNRRALGFGVVPPLIFTALGAWLWAASTASANRSLVWLGGAMVAIGSVLVVSLVTQMCRPRIAYRDGKVLFQLDHGPPIAVPVGLVEAFFLGQGPLALPGAPQEDAAVNLVARLSQRDPSFAQREVKPALGAWCDHYVTIRGTWCEPLNGEVVRRLNRRLKEVTEVSSAVGPTA